MDMHNHTPYCYDIFALAGVIIRMMGGKMPAENSGWTESLAAVMEQGNYTNNLADILTSMLLPLKSDQDITVSDVKESAWYQGYSNFQDADRKGLSASIGSKFEPAKMEPKFSPTNDSI